MRSRITLTHLFIVFLRYRLPRFTIFLHDWLMGFSNVLPIVWRKFFWNHLAKLVIFSRLLTIFAIYLRDLVTKLAVFSTIDWRISRYFPEAIWGISCFFLEIIWRIFRLLYEDELINFAFDSAAIWRNALFSPKIIWRNLSFFLGPIVENRDIFMRLTEFSIILVNIFVTFVIYFCGRLTKFVISAILWQSSRFFSTVAWWIWQFPPRPFEEIRFSLPRSFDEFCVLLLSKPLKEFRVFYRELLANFAILPRLFSKIRCFSPRLIVEFRDIFTWRFDRIMDFS